MHDRDAPSGPAPYATIDIFLLSPDIIKPFLPLTELKVYIPHPNPDDLALKLQSQPYGVAIKLVLLMETRDVLHSQGYSTELREPDPDHLTTHWLTLSKDEHTVTVEFQHALKYDGRGFEMQAYAKMSGSRPVPLDSAPHSYYRPRPPLVWSDTVPWSPTPNILYPPSQVSFGVPAAGGLTVDLGLEFAGAGDYYVHIGIRNGAPPAYSAVVKPSPGLGLPR